MPPENGATDGCQCQKQDKDKMEQISQFKQVEGGFREEPSAYEAKFGDLTLYAWNDREKNKSGLTAIYKGLGVVSRSELSEEAFVRITGHVQPPSVEELADALDDLLQQLEGVGVYIPGEDAGQWRDAAGLSFSKAEMALKKAKNYGRDK